MKADASFPKASTGRRGATGFRRVHADEANRPYAVHHDGVAIDHPRHTLRLGWFCKQQTGECRKQSDESQRRHDYGFEQASGVVR